MAATSRYHGPSLPSGHAPRRPMSALVRRTADADTLPSGPSRGSVAAASDYDIRSFDACHAPARSPQTNEDATCQPPVAQSEAQTQSLDRRFLYAFQQKMLSTLRLEFQEEAARLRQFFKKAMKEAKEELLVDISLLQQGPAAAASKILGAVWEVLEEVKASKDTLNRSDILQTIREHRQEVDLSEVLTSVDDIKRRLDIAHIISPQKSSNAVLGEEPRLEVGLPEVLSEIRSIRVTPQQIDFSEVLQAIRETRAEVDLSSVLAAIRQQGAEVSAAIVETTAVVRESHDSASLLEVFREVQEMHAALDLSPVPSAITDARQAETATATEATAKAADPVAKAEVPAGNASLPALLDAFREERAEILRAIGEMSNAKPCSIDLVAVMSAISQEKEIVLEAVSGIQETLSKDQGMGEALGKLREEAATMAASRCKLAEALTAQAERRTEGEEDIRQGLQAVRDLKKTIVLDLQPVLAGLDHAEVKMARVCEQLMAKLEAQHLEVVGMMAHLCGSGLSGRRSPCPRGRKA